jgi:hypothetical protein
MERSYENYLPTCGNHGESTIAGVRGGEETSGYEAKMKQYETNYC